jgi:hypothetical protein
MPASKVRTAAARAEAPASALIDAKIAALDDWRATQAGDEKALQALIRAAAELNGASSRR